ncbi:MAG: glycosyltransferase, partial [Phycisphaerae bacterium]
ARQLEEMEKQGADIEVIVPMVKCPKFLSNFQRWRIYNHQWRCEFKGIKAISAPYFRLPGKWFRHWAFIAVFMAVRKQVIKLHQKKPFDIIYARFLFPEGYAAVRLSETLKIPVVGVGAGDEINIYPNDSIVFKKDMIWILRKLNGIISSGAKVASNIIELSGRKPLMIYGVVDLNEFSPVIDKFPIRKLLGIEDKLTVLYVGTFKVAKGVHEMVEAFIRISRKMPNVQFIICGYGREEEKMRVAIKKAEAGEVIKIMGIVDSQEVHKWMQASDIFILPSYSEGMPNSVMEAMACGLPIVATKVGGLPEAIGDCKGATLIEPKNIEELTNAIIKIADDTKLRKKMCIESRKRAEEKFGLQRNSEKILEFFSGIIQSGRDIKI